MSHSDLKMKELEMKLRHLEEQYKLAKQGLWGGLSYVWDGNYWSGWLIGGTSNGVSDKCWF